MLHWSELLNFARILVNRPSDELDDDAFWSLYTRATEPRGRADLLCVLMTYNRPEASCNVLQALHEALAGEPAFVLVLNDRSDSDYTATRAAAVALFGERLFWLDARERIGKPGFWKAYQVAFLVARAQQPSHALFLQDDLGFEPDLLQRTRRLWSATAADPLRRVLYLFSSEEDERFGRWVLALRRAAGAGLRLTQWFDLQAFFVDRAFFELLAYRMVPVHRNRWRRKPRVSSGVGKQLTLRLRGRANVYQAYPPLVFHGGLESEMNPQARARRALDNRALAELARVNTSQTGSRDD
ncbi:MAG TPA: hypothetical protein VFX59_17575 [Polyangiales bacterium]|nr:hypothetical protein [Polyangiales bacterium]